VRAAVEWERVGEDRETNTSSIFFFPSRVINQPATDMLFFGFRPPFLESSPHINTKKGAGWAFFVFLENE
jgi:hypothetical protein